MRNFLLISTFSHIKNIQALKIVQGLKLSYVLGFKAKLMFIREAGDLNSAASSFALN